MWLSPSRRAASGGAAGGGAAVVPYGGADGPGLVALTSAGCATPPPAGAAAAPAQGPAQAGGAPRLSLCTPPPVGASFAKDAGEAAAGGGAGVSTISPPVHTSKVLSSSSDEWGFCEGDLVEVAARTWPGINKPGGVGKVVRCNPDGTYNVSYVLGGSEKNVAREYITSKSPFHMTQRPKKERDFFINYEQTERPGGGARSGSRNNSKGDSPTDGGSEATSVASKDGADLADFSGEVPSGLKRPRSSTAFVAAGGEQLLVPGGTPDGKRRRAAGSGAGAGGGAGVVSGAGAGAEATANKENVSGSSAKEPVIGKLTCKVFRSMQRIHSSVSVDSAATDEPQARRKVRFLTSGSGSVADENEPRDERAEVQPQTEAVGRKPAEADLRSATAAEPKKQEQKPPRSARRAAPPAPEEPPGVCARDELDREEDARAQQLPQHVQQAQQAHPSQQEQQQLDTSLAMLVSKKPGAAAVQRAARSIVHEPRFAPLSRSALVPAAAVCAATAACPDGGGAAGGRLVRLAKLSGPAGALQATLELQRAERQEMETRFLVEQNKVHKTLIDGLQQEMSRDYHSSLTRLESACLAVNRFWRPVAREPLDASQRKRLVRKTGQQWLKLRDTVLARQRMEAGILHSRQLREILTLAPHITPELAEEQGLVPHAVVKYQYDFGDSEADNPPQQHEPQQDDP